MQSEGEEPPEASRKGNLERFTGAWLAAASRPHQSLAGARPTPVGSERFAEPLRSGDGTTAAPTLSLHRSRAPSGSAR